jgi:hypothetical protein
LKTAPEQICIGLRSLGTEGKFNGSSCLSRHELGGTIFITKDATAVITMAQVLKWGLAIGADDQVKQTFRSDHSSNVLTARVMI